MRRELDCGFARFDKAGKPCYHDAGFDPTGEKTEEHPRFG